MDERIVNLRKYKYLFVEDEDDLVNIIKNLMDTFEVDYKTARNGVEALEVLNDNKIDILVTDVNMPKMDGFELIREVQKLSPDLPIVIMTAHTEKEKIEESKKLGVCHYLPKPLDMFKLIDVISKIISTNDS
jgi:YesN/AraC family two-component response regulator